MGLGKDGEKKERGEGRGQAEGSRGCTGGNVPRVLYGGRHCLLGGESAQVGKGMGGEVPVPVVLVSRKVMALSGMPHTLRTDTWQV